MIRRSLTLPLATALLAAAVGAGGGAATYALLDSGGPKTVVRQVSVTGAEPAAASTGGLSIREIYRRSYKSVVEVTVSSTSTSPFGDQEQRQGQGSGFVYDKDGHIVTNQHVVDEASSVSVRFWNGRDYKARVLGTDPSTDLAVLKVDAPASLLSPLRLADSSGVSVGDGVVAIGSPFGLEQTATTGIVSALHRQISSPNDFTIDDSIQTDAAINHGNSGGPLIDMNARVIGVNAQIESDSGGNDGVGFAIPSNTVRSIVAQLLEDGTAEHSYLGVVLEASAPGARIANVRPGSPAADAGLRRDDVVTELDRQKVTDADQLRAAIAAHRPGETVELTYRRDGKIRTAEVKLASRPS